MSNPDVQLSRLQLPFFIHKQAQVTGSFAPLTPYVPMMWSASTKELEVETVHVGLSATMWLSSQLRVCRRRWPEILRPQALSPLSDVLHCALLINPKTWGIAVAHSAVEPSR